jgi:hypothetical protein
MKGFLLGACLLGMFAVAGSLRAQSLNSNAGSQTDSNGVMSVIELDANDYVVNLDATQDGISNPGGDPTGDSLPGSSTTVYVPSISFNLAPGTYTLQNASLLSAAADPNFTAWNFQAGNSTPWVWEFLAVQVPDASTGAGTVLANYTPEPYERFTTQAGAAAYATPYMSTITISSAETVAFALDDNALGDNAGGVSFEISAAPEPNAFWLAGGGLLLMLAYRRAQHARA